MANRIYWFQDFCLVGGLLQIATDWTSVKAGHDGGKKYLMASETMGDKLHCIDPAHDWFDQDVG
ncbi:hypothetical protein BVRB_7g170300 [Beta vulgaris subsp. vulgaris]|nr:hypothetical protein BVRB_7g170300 [Beta vulgaris subsp. vulgaris]